MSSCTVACQRTVRQCQLTCGKKLEERMSEKEKQTEELVSQRIWWGSTPANVHSLYVCVVLLLDDVRCAAKLPPCISLWLADAISFVQTDQQHWDESLGFYVGYKRSRHHPFSSHLSSVTGLWIATSFSNGNFVHLIYSFPPLGILLKHIIHISRYISCVLLIELSINHMLLNHLLIVHHLGWNWPCWRRFWRRFLFWV